jgi:hypothetical protein
MRHAIYVSIYLQSRYILAERTLIQRDAGIALSPTCVSAAAVLSGCGAWQEHCDPKKQHASSLACPNTPRTTEAASVEA